MKITADTITTKQIRDLLSEFCAEDPTGGANRSDVEACSLALQKRRDPEGVRLRINARARCAEILNARHVANVYFNGDGT